MIRATVIADSIAENGKRITTFELEYPRFIHAEFMTHRMISKNSASSRAIPIKKMIEQVRTNPAMPVFWGSNRSGMQATEELVGWRLWLAKFLWLRARDVAVVFAWLFHWVGLHKQIGNRCLEPFFNIKIVATATEWDNFFALRCHKDAQPEIQALAQTMYSLYIANRPKLLGSSDWHLPYVSDLELGRITGLRSDKPLDLSTALKVSVARCARVSYGMFDGSTPDVNKDIFLYDRLVGSAPLHASPTEHQASPALFSWKRSGNLMGWNQYRKLLSNENIEKYIPNQPS